MKVNERVGGGRASEQGTDGSSLPARERSERVDGLGRE